MGANGSQAREVATEEVFQQLQPLGNVNVNDIQLQYVFDQVAYDKDDDPDNNKDHYTSIIVKYKDYVGVINGYSYSSIAPRYLQPISIYALFIKKYRKNMIFCEDCSRLKLQLSNNDKIEILLYRYTHLGLSADKPLVDNHLTDNQLTDKQLTNE